MIKTYKYRLKDRSAKKLLRRHAIACNQVWNYCVAVQRETEKRYKAGSKPKWLSQYDLQKLCKGAGAMLGIHQQTVQCVCERFAAARDKIRHAPKFRQSYGAVANRGVVPFQAQSRQTSGNSVTYLGRTMRYFGDKRRRLPDSTKGGHFVEDGLGRWWVCFTVEVPDPVAPATGEIGLDLGLKNFAALSDGTVVEAPRFFRQLEQKLATAQRAGNKRRIKAIHARIANSRRDFHHKFSTDLAGRNALIAVGNVNTSRLAKTGMAKSVLDAGWSAFRSMLRYKSPGFVEVDEKFTTQTCSDCKSVSGPKGITGLGIREWVCSSCGSLHDRDVNAAKNILALARSAPRLVEESRRVA